jgi:excisionase family DNA binding protein
MLSTIDVAQLLGISEAAVHRLVQRGRLRAIRKGRGKRRVYVTGSVIAEMERRGLTI